MLGLWVPTAPTLHFSLSIPTTNSCISCRCQGDGKAEAVRAQGGGWEQSILEGISARSHASLPPGTAHPPVPVQTKAQSVPAEAEGGWRQNDPAALPAHGLSHRT